jgi:Protein of unknown function (DUF3011)
MESLLLSSLAAILGMFIVLASPRPSPAGSFPVPQRQIISCSSDDMKRNYCDADVRGGVQLVKQRSEAPCVFNRTWGFDNDRGIWVDRGCRADFQLGGDSNGSDTSHNMYCASDDGHRNLCPADTRGGVQMVRKRSGASCDYGSSWGYDDRGVWVDRGCRADFQIGGGRGDRGGDRDRDKERDRDGDRNRDGDRDRDRDKDRDRDRSSDDGGPRDGDAAVQVVSCSSDDMNRHECQVNTRGGVRLIRQRSEADCVLDRTWGYDRHSIWVDRGCRADFEVGAKR